MDKPMSSFDLLERFVFAENKSGRIIEESVKVIDLSGMYSGGVIFLTDGVVSLHRKLDDLLIANVTAPYIFGGVMNNVEHRYYYIRLKSRARVRWVDKKTFIKTVEKHHLWIYLCQISSHILSYMVDRDLTLVNNDRYSIVRTYIHEINESTERYSTNVISYISDRSGLSKSGIAAILMELKKGGYIKMNNGVLIEITVDLPQKL